MSRLEILERDTWQDFLAAPAAVLMLGKTDCQACAAWTKELEEFLESDQQWDQVRFGKLELDRPGFGQFKRENDWIAGVDDLPYNVIFVEGERKKEFVGAGAQRLANRLTRVLGES